MRAYGTWGVFSSGTPKSDCWNVSGVGSLRRRVCARRTAPGRGVPRHRAHRGSGAAQTAKEPLRGDRAEPVLEWSLLPDLRPAREMRVVGPKEAEAPRRAPARLDRPKIPGGLAARGGGSAVGPRWAVG